MAGGARRPAAPGWPYGCGVVDPANTADALRSRAPLDAWSVAAQLAAGARWRIRVVAETGSTNDNLAAQAAGGAEPGEVLIADLQTAGRGRRQRLWTAPAGAGLTLSVLLGAPEVPAARFGWVAILGGVSLAAAVSRLAHLDAGLKWPNDLLVGGAKCAGVLATGCGDGIVVLGLGLNVSLTRAELPRADATSLQLAGAATLDRAVLAAGVLDELGIRFHAWRAAGGDPVRSGLRAEYLDRCVTIGQQVRAELPGGGGLIGRAVDLTADGALVVDAPGGRVSLTAADVQHLRPVATGPVR